MSTIMPTAVPAPPPPLDMERAGAFAGRMMSDLGGALVGLVCALGDRLGLFRVLAVSGPVTSGELAERAGIRERYAREWLSVLACAGYVEYDPESGSFSLPPEHAAVLAWEGSPMFLGGGLQQLPALAARLDDLARAFREGGGVPQAAYGEDLREGMERMSGTWFDNLLAQAWIPAVPGLREKLEGGARVADVGCGSGRALIALARAFPASTFTGFDFFAPVLARAAANAEAAGVGDRVRFERRDVAEGLPGGYDLVTTFDSVHDFADVHGGLAAIRRALAPGGVYLLLEMNAPERLEEAAGPVGSILYATSVLYNLPVSLAHGGEGVGTMGLPESRIRALCAEAGFGSVRRVPVPNPINVLYEVRP